MTCQPTVGIPPLLWEDFKTPRLRRFPGSQEDIELERCIKWGMHGLVIKGHIKGLESPVVIKIVGQSSPIELTLC